MADELPDSPIRRVSFDRIWFDPTTEPPQLTVGKTSLAVTQILEELQAGTDIANLVEAFPMLGLDDVAQCLAFADAAALLAGPIPQPDPTHAASRD